MNSSPDPVSSTSEIYQKPLFLLGCCNVFYDWQKNGIRHPYETSTGLQSHDAVITSKVLYNLRQSDKTCCHLAIHQLLLPSCICSTIDVVVSNLFSDVTDESVQAIFSSISFELQTRFQLIAWKQNRFCFLVYTCGRV